MASKIIMSTPTRADVKVGHWVVLRDYWVVGPILPPKYPEEADQWALQVKTGNYPTGMTVVTGEIDGCGVSDDPHSDSPRRIMFTGTKKEALAYAMQCALADEIMEEIIAEENIDKIIRIPSHACP
jgi:hypothetical protein